ncbi:MAG TPA: hypothetical protein HA224_01115 [Nanoarchaeota archaeon]|nr:hypothetical protein [Nanoarchaeota archaeon]
MQPHDFKPRRFVLASGMLLILIAIVFLLGSENAPITGSFIAGNEYFSNIQGITATSELAEISTEINFPESYMPISLDDCRTVFITDSINTITNYSLSLAEENGICISANLVFANPIYNSTEINETSYTVYFGKSLQKITFSSETPANNAILTSNNIVITAELSLPEVPTLVWNGNNEPMIGNGTTWQASKANLSNADYTFKVITEKVTTGLRTITMNYTIPLVQNQTDTTNSTNTTNTNITIIPWLSFTSATPANGTTLTTNALVITLNASFSPIVEFNSSGTIYTYSTTQSETNIWQKSFTGMANGLYKYRAYLGNLSTEIRYVRINYTVPATNTSNQTTSAEQTPQAQAESLQAELLIINSKPSKDITFNIPLKNTGTRNITSISGTVEVYKAGSFLETIDLVGTPSLLPDETGQLSAQWAAPEFEKYYADAKVVWNSQSFIASQNFTVGEPLLEVEKFAREQNGAKAKITLTLANRWIEPINAVNPKFNIYNGSQIVSSVYTSQQDIPAKSPVEFTAEFEITDIQSVKVDAVVEYSGKTLSQSLEAAKTQVIASEPPKVEAPKQSGLSGITGAFLKIGEGNNKITTIIASAVLLAGLVVLVGFKLPRDRKKAYIEEYKRRAKLWQEYVQKTRQTGQPLPPSKPNLPFQ